MQSDDGRRGGGGGKGAATDKPAPDSIVKLRPPVGILYEYQNVFKNFFEKCYRKEASREESEVDCGRRNNNRALIPCDCIPSSGRV